MIYFVAVAQHKQYGYTAPVIYLYAKEEKEALTEAKSKSRLADFPDT